MQIRYFLFLAPLLVACSSARDGSPTDDVAHLNETTDIALAGNLPGYCDGPEMHRVQRPVASDGSAAGTFSYGFRYKPPSVEGAPVLVYLPGGPGSASTENPPAFLPQGWGYLLTDPRGVGCNTPESVPPSDTSWAFFRTIEIANDVVAAIRDRDVNNYVLFGISYGTLLATVVSHRIEEESMARPRAVVLEGVLGKAFGSDDANFAGSEYIRQWERVRAALPADVLSELDGRASPYGISSEGWSRLLTGILPASPSVTANLLARMSQTFDAPTHEATLTSLKSMAENHPHTEPGAVELYREVACREIMDTVPASDLDVIFQGGHLVRNRSEEGTKCRELHLVTPFDAAAWPVQTKTFYFIGDSDVATPPWQGAYNFEHHAGPAVRVVTQGGGHNSLQFNQGSCAPALLTSIAGGGSDLNTVLGTCPMPVTVDVK